MPEQDLLINAVAATTPAKSYYLTNIDGTNNLISTLASAILVATGQATSVILQKDGHVRIDSAAPFSVSWGASTLLRDLLGFDANLALNASYTAPNISPLLWMPGKPETPLMQRLGVVGHRVHAVYQAVAPYSGRTESVTHGVREYARYLFPMVDTDRVVTAGNDGGTFGRWFDAVAVRSARFKLWRDVLESVDTYATESAMLTLTEPLGPYIYTADRRGLSWKYDLSRGFERTDRRADIQFDCHVCEDYA
jgi:hypothetical protein